MPSAQTHGESINGFQAFRAEAEQVLPTGTLTTDLADLVMFGYDASKRYGNPDIVATPASQDDAVKLIALAAKHTVPITTRGAGSGLTGGAVPAQFFAGTADSVQGSGGGGLGLS